MKYIEYACYDYSLTEIETQQNISSAIKSGIKNISILPYSINSIKNIEGFKNEDINLSCPIDFPNGILDAKSRNFTVSQLVKNGLSSLDIMAPSKILANRKYDKLREDIRSNLDICLEKNVKLRYILEYRIFNHEILAKVCQILMSLGIDTIIPSSGMMIDDINDSLIACNFLSVKSGINVICNANIYNRNHIKLIKSANTFGIRLNNLSTIDLIKEKYTK